MESLVIQDYTNWRIITRDDGSKDDTVALVAAWKERLGARMEIIENLEETNLGAVGNYDRLLQNCNASLVMMGDPDDVWKPGKITLVLNAMLEAERTYGSELPIIICTDAEMVDANLKPISPSFWKWTQVRSEFLSVVPRMLMENPALGATMIMNRAVLSHALPLSRAAACQDWWLALVACAFGKVVALNNCTISYRRHAGNNSDVPLTASLFYAFQNIFFMHKRLQRIFQRVVLQATEFAGRYGDHLGLSDIAALEAVANFSSMSFFGRRWAIVRHRLWFASPIRNIGLMILL